MSVTEIAAPAGRIVSLDQAERIQLLGVLPQSGDVTTIRIVRELRESLSFTEEEHDKLGLKVMDTGDGRSTYQWNPGVNLRRDFTFKPKACAVIAEALTGLDKRKQLPIACLGLYEVFVGE